MKNPSIDTTPPFCREGNIKKEMLNLENDPRSCLYVKVRELNFLK